MGIQIAGRKIQVKNPNYIKGFFQTRKLHSDNFQKISSFFLEVVLKLENELITGKSFSEALILASNNPQYDKRLFIELQVQYMKIASSEHVVYTNCFLF